MNPYLHLSTLPQSERDRCNALLAAGWVQMKQFRRDEADRLQCGESTVCKKLARGDYAQTPIIRFNPRVVLVNPQVRP